MPRSILDFHPALSDTFPRMNFADRQELDAILREQLRVRNLLAVLDQRVAALDRRLAEPAPAEPPPLPKIAPPPVRAEPAGVADHVAPAPSAPSPPQTTALPVPPPRIEQVPVSPALPTKPAPPPAPTPAAPAESIELKLGTYWLARIGIVILLTGFVFLGNYAYRHLVPLLGAWGKLALLALGGAALTGAGLWLERGRESMRNYARVLLAGGAATFYYTAYAAHFVAPLRVIESPLLGGALLLALAGGFLWFAERRRSQSLALSAILLSYYTAAINPIGTFALFSNLLLTATAVFLLVRHRWVAISFVSLAATYGTYGFWRFHAVAGTGAGGSEFGVALGFLAGYWLLFTVAVFVAKGGALPGLQRTAFLTVNNAALFIYAAQHFGMHRPGAFWVFALGYGVVLLALAALAARRQPEEHAFDGAYLAQGLALLALGCAAKLSGPQLATVFAVESAVLLTLARTRHRWLYEIAAGLTALAAFGLALDGLEKNPALALSLGGSVAALLLFDAWWVKRIRGELTALQLSVHALGFALLGLGLAGAVIWKTAPPTWQPAALAGAALVCALSVRAVRLPEIALPGQAFLLVGVGTFLVRHFDLTPEPTWSPLPVLGLALALTHWWQRQRTLPLGSEASSVLQIACATCAVATGLGWLHLLHRGEGWLYATSAAALATLLYGAVTRAWAVALVGQLFTVLSVQAFLGGVFFGNSVGSHAALAPIANLAATSFLVSRLVGQRFPALPAGASLAPLALLYRLAANVSLLAWGWTFVDPTWQTVFFAALGAAYVFAGALKRDREYGDTAFGFAAFAFLFFWFPAHADGAVWKDLFAILALPASQRVGQRFAGDTTSRSHARNALVAAALASVWLWLTRYVTAHYTSSGLTPAWALLALAVFIAGLGLRERVYRLGGFILLALAVGRIFLVDVWQLETLYRILSFLILGAVLLLLGYLYNRFAETIRRWL